MIKLSGPGFLGKVLLAGFASLVFVSALHGQDTTAPLVSSIERQNPTSERTSADALAWRVTFNEGVRAADLGLTQFQNVLDGSSTFFDGSIALASVEIDGTPLIFAPGFRDHGLTVLDITPDNIFRTVHNVADNDDVYLNQAAAAYVHRIGDTHYLYVGSRGDDGVSVFTIANNGTLTNIQNIGDNEQLQLGGVSDIHAASVGGQDYLFVTGQEDWGVSVFQIAADGQITSVFNVNDGENSDFELAGARSAVTAVINGITYLYVAGIIDHGLTIFSVGNEGALTFQHRIIDTAAIFVNGAGDLEHLQIGEQNYIYVSGSADLGVSAFSILSNGNLQWIQNLQNGNGILAANPKEMTVTRFQGQTFLSVASSAASSGSPDRGVQVFAVGSDGRLTPILREFASPQTPMYSAFSITSLPTPTGFRVFVGNSNGAYITMLTLVVEPIAADDFETTGTTATLTASQAAPNIVDVSVSGGDLASLNGPVTLAIAAGHNLADLAGNALTNLSPQGADEGFTVDNLPPDVSLSHNGTLPIDAPFTLTITFTEGVSGFDQGDIAVTNASLSNFQAQSGSVYTVTVTPAGESNLTLGVAQNAATDGAGFGNTAATPLDLASVPRRTVTVTLPGLGAGMVTSVPAGIECENDCSEAFLQGEAVTLTAAAAFGSAFASWVEGPCSGSTNPQCAFSANETRTVAARFTSNNVPEGRIVAATLPAARSGYTGGPDITVFMSVVSRATTPAQSCRITAAGGDPVTLSYRRVDANNAAIGPADPVFDLLAGGTASFVLALSPVSETGLQGVDFQPQVTCENANLGSVVGLNTVFLSIQNAPVPDILSISSTASGDGTIRIAEAGRAGVMTAALVNIGAGDGSAGASGITLTTTADTGAANLPVTIEVCQIDATTAACITPRGPSVTTSNLGRNEPAFFAAFVRDNSNGAGIPFSPANSRVFLRFSDASGTVRSATSAAVTVPPTE